jgi:hypothetical protein
MAERREYLKLREALDKCPDSAVGFFQKELWPILTDIKNYGFVYEDTYTLSVLVKRHYVTVCQRLSELVRFGVLRKIDEGYYCPPLLADAVEKCLKERGLHAKDVGRNVSGLQTEG